MEIDLSHYSEPLGHYIGLYEEHLAALKGPRVSQPEAKVLFQKRVTASWGLIAKGAAAAPYALSLLTHSEPEAREDGAAILGEIGREDAVVDHLVSLLETECDDTPRDSILLALGRLKNKRAIPVLARIIRDESIDGDTRWTAIESLGYIVRKRFLKQEDPHRAALAWLDSHAALAAPSG